jgi:nucleoside-diphosphate-sugar epimerase
MKVVVTGGAGFLGQQLIRALCERGCLADAEGRERVIGRIVAVDVAQGGPLHADDRVHYVAGDITAAGFIDPVLGTDTDSVFHLAAVVSGAAEADFDLGMRVNLDGTRAVLNACRRQARKPKLVFTSSLAVFGGELPAVVTDEIQPTPQSSYGIQKLIGELLVGDGTRKGFVDGRAIRLPTIVVRPGKPNAAASSFASGIIREPLAGVDAICPVEPQTAMYLLSPRCAVASLIHAHELPADRWGTRRSLTLPGLTVTVAQMLDVLREVGGDAAAARVRIQPDEKVGAIVKTWPPHFATPRAASLGFVGDSDFTVVVRNYAREYAAAAR